MHSLARILCVGLVLSACSAGKKPFRSNNVPDGAAAAEAADASGELGADARSISYDTHDSSLALPDVGQATCGNGRLDPGEQCDDGNSLADDGCSRNCQWEDPCPYGPGCPRPTRVCGNGVVTPNEQCDDGNVMSGDGCSVDCLIEPGWRCRVPGMRCTPLCGDHVRIGGETCDDGNTQGGDGCSARCQAEPGWDCSSDICIQIAPLDGGIDLGDNTAGCGDGVISDPLEECDCGNGTVSVPNGCVGPNADDAYGGCTTICLYGPYCGDGQVNGAEECDLGALNGQDMSKDGCTFACTKPHYCGDGILDTSLGEECDLGSLNGLVLDRNLNPTTDPNGMVLCGVDCRVGIPLM